MQPICSCEQLSLNETLLGSRLFEHEVRVKAARIEFSENVSSKSGWGFGYFCTKSNSAWKAFNIK